MRQLDRPGRFRRSLARRPVAFPRPRVQVLLTPTLPARKLHYSFLEPSGQEVCIIDDSYCRFYPYVTAGRYAALSVSDAGVGMDVEMRERFFEPSAVDGEEALRLCESETPALAILDLVMPKLGGLDTAAKLAERFVRIPVLFTNGYSQESRGLDTTARYLQNPLAPRV